MSNPTPERAPKAGGFLLAVSIVAGAILGGLLGQPSIGFLVGVAAGILLIGLVWLLDRR